MAMADCRYCHTRITTQREARAPRKVGYWTFPAVSATWLHLVDGHDDHTPEPPPKKGKKTKAEADELTLD